MMNKKEITKFAKAIIHSQKGLKNQQLMHPKREWLTGIVVALSIFIASITWSSIEYFKYQNIEQQNVSPSAAAAAVYRESLVTEALSAYAAKAERLNTLLGENAPVIPNDNVDGEEVNAEEEVGIESSQDVDAATTTQAAASSSDNQVTTENEGQTETGTSPEETTLSENSAPPTEEGSIQPATNI